MCSSLYTHHRTMAPIWVRLSSYSTNCKHRHENIATFPIWNLSTMFVFSRFNAFTFYYWQYFQLSALWRSFHGATKTSLNQAATRSHHPKIQISDTSTIKIFVISSLLNLVQELDTYQHLKLLQTSCLDYFFLPPPMFYRVTNFMSPRTVLALLVDSPSPLPKTLAAV